jgi:guanosine-3',5'-bis(diphosphate) 3'-pyrophosphohydrolase
MLKLQQSSDSVAFGRRLLNRSLGTANRSIKDFDFRRLRRVFKQFGVRRLDQLLGAIGNGEVMAYVVAQSLLVADDASVSSVTVESGGPVAIRGGEGLVVSYARCCGPIPGDQIVGHVTPGKGFVVHVETCRNMAEMRRRHGGRDIIPAQWSAAIRTEFSTTLRVDVNRRKGVIAGLASAAAAADAGVDSIGVTERNAIISTISLQLSVRDRKHLAQVVRKLRALSDVVSIARTGS